MAYNRSPSKDQSDGLGTAAEVYRGWQLEVECGGDACPVGRCHKMDSLAKHYPGCTVGTIISRLKCVACGKGPESVVLVDPRRPDRRVALRRPECRY